MTHLPSPVPAPTPGAAAPPISRAIYGMPMFATLLVADLDRTTSWYVDALGFINLFTVPGPAGPALVHLRRWQFQDLLVRPAPEPVRPAAGCPAELRRRLRRARRPRRPGPRARRRTRTGPDRHAMEHRDLTTTDPDGNVVVLTAARPPDRTDPAFAERMRRWNAEQGAALRQRA